MLEQIDRVDPHVNAVVTRVDEAARDAARRAEDAIQRGEDVGALHGVPVVIKDLHPVTGVRTTFGSRLYENFVPDWSQIRRRAARGGRLHRAGEDQRTRIRPDPPDR